MTATYVIPARPSAPSEPRGEVATAHYAHLEQIRANAFGVGQAELWEEMYEVAEHQPAARNLVVEKPEPESALSWPIGLAAVLTLLTGLFIFLNV